MDYYLAQRFLAGEVEAGNELVRRNYLQVYKWVDGKIFSRPNRDDIVADRTQEAFTRALRNIHRYKGSSSFYTWVCGIANYCITEFLREEQDSREFLVEEVDHEEAQYDYYGDPEEILLRKEEYQTLWKVFGSLNKDYQEILIRRLINQQPYAEITGAMGRSEDALESLFRRAVQALRREFMKAYS